MLSVMRNFMEDRTHESSSSFGLLPELFLNFSPRDLFQMDGPRLLARLSSGTVPNKYRVRLNVEQFRPEEIEVKIVDDSVVVIHCKHEEKEDEHGLVSREFSRRIQLPDDVEPDAVESSISLNGVLTIQAPRKQLECQSKNEMIIPITIQGNGKQLESPSMNEMIIPVTIQGNSKQLEYQSKNEMIIPITMQSSEKQLESSSMNEMIIPVTIHASEKQLESPLTNEMIIPVTIQAPGKQLESPSMNEMIIPITIQGNGKQVESSSENETIIPVTIQQHTAHVAEYIQKQQQQHDKQVSQQLNCENRMSIVLV